jgi:hypothetical protein
MTPAPSPVEVARREAGDRLQTEFTFELPLGYVDESGERHRRGVMRLATARDEIMPLRDPRVRDNDAYLTVLLLSRVVTELGTLAAITPAVVEGLFAADLAFLQDLYSGVNQEGHSRVPAVCPQCKHPFEVDVAGDRLGGSAS